MNVVEGGEGSRWSDDVAHHHCCVAIKLCLTPQTHYENISIMKNLDFVKLIKAVSSSRGSMQFGAHAASATSRTEFIQSYQDRGSRISRHNLDGRVKSKRATGSRCACNVC